MCGRTPVRYLAAMIVTSVAATFVVRSDSIPRMLSRTLDGMSAKLSGWQLSAESESVEDSRQAYDDAIADRKVMDENLRSLQAGRNALRLRSTRSDSGVPDQPALEAELARYDEAVAAVAAQLAQLDRQLASADGELALRGDVLQRRRLLLESNRLAALTNDKLRAIGLPPASQRPADGTAADPALATPTPEIALATEVAAPVEEPVPSAEIQAPDEVQGHTALVKVELAGTEGTSDEYWLGVIPAAAPSSVWAQGVKLRRGVNSRYVYVGRPEEPSDAGAYQVIVFRVPAGKITGEGEINVREFEEFGATELKSCMVTRR